MTAVLCMDLKLLCEQGRLMQNEVFGEIMDNGNIQFCLHVSTSLANKIY